MTDVRSLRADLGVTQIELAAMLGLHQSTISRLESGTLPLDERTRLALEALSSRKRVAEKIEGDRPAAPSEPAPPFPTPPQGADLAATAQPNPTGEKHGRNIPNGFASSSASSPTRSSESAAASGKKVAA